MLHIAFWLIDSMLSPHQVQLFKPGALTPMDTGSGYRSSEAGAAASAATGSGRVEVDTPAGIDSFAIATPCSSSHTSVPATPIWTEAQIQDLQAAIELQQVHVYQLQSNPQLQALEQQQQDQQREQQQQQQQQQAQVEQLQQQLLQHKELLHQQQQLLVNQQHHNKWQQQQLLVHQQSVVVPQMQPHPPTGAAAMPPAGAAPHQMPPPMPPTGPPPPTGHRVAAAAAAAVAAHGSNINVQNGFMCCYTHGSDLKQICKYCIAIQGLKVACVEAQIDPVLVYQQQVQPLQQQQLVDQQQQHQQQDAATAAATAAAGTIAASAAGQRLAIAATVPTPKHVFTDEDRAAFDNALDKYGLDKNPGRWSNCCWELHDKRRFVRQHMDALYASAPKESWEYGSVPKDCNAQSFLATNALLNICRPRGCFDDKMLATLFDNIRLLTVAFQDIKFSEGRALFMRWFCPEWQEQEFIYKRHNADFVKWLQYHTPECLQWFEHGHYGLWEWPYRMNLLVTLIVKLPITDGSFQRISHKDVINKLVDTCQSVGNLWHALMAACDIMVSDYHGNSEHQTYWYKALYLKYAATRQDAICAILNQIPQLSCYEDGQIIYWGAEMKANNKPPAKKQYAIAVPQVQKVFMDGPNGGTDIS